MLITSPTTLVSRVDLVVREKGGDFSQNWPLRWQHVTHFLSYAFAKYGNISKIFFFFFFSNFKEPRHKTQNTQQYTMSIVCL